MKSEAYVYFPRSKDQISYASEFPEAFKNPCPRCLAQIGQDCMNVHFQKNFASRARYPVRPHRERTKKVSMIKYFLKNPELRFEMATPGASGYDVMSDISTMRELHPGERWKVPTGLHLEMQEGVEGQVRSRSGLALHHGVVVLNAPGTIDSDYRGEIFITLINLGQLTYQIIPGARIAQIVFARVHHPDNFLQVESLDMLSDSTRGSSGHGSTGT